MDMLSPVPGADQNQTRIYPWLALFDKPDPEREAVRSEERAQDVDRYLREYNDTPNFDHKRSARLSASHLEEIIDAPPRGESYGTDKRVVTATRLDVVG